MIKHMDKVYTLMPMEPNIRVNGRKTSNMGRVLRHGQTEPCMKENIVKVKKMDKANSLLQMGQSIKATLK